MLTSHFRVPEMPVPKQFNESMVAPGLLYIMMRFKTFWVDAAFVHIPKKKMLIVCVLAAGESAINCQNDDTDLIPPLEHCIRTR